MAEQPDLDSLTQHPTWNQGDFTLISSDNVVFKAPSRILFCVSEVLADAADISSGDKRVHLGDPDIETSEVLEHFLEFGCQGKLRVAEVNGNEDYCTVVGRLIAFLQKYDCGRLLTYLELAVLKFLAGGLLTVMDAFAIGSAADATFVCQSALERGVYELDGNVDSPLIFGQERQGQPLASLSGGCALDPATMSLAASRIAQPKHLWALNRAWSLCHVVDVGGPPTDSNGNMYPTADRVLQTIPIKFMLLIHNMGTTNGNSNAPTTNQSNTD